MAERWGATVVPPGPLSLRLGRRKKADGEKMVMVLNSSSSGRVKPPFIKPPPLPPQPKFKSFLKTM